MHLYFVHVGQAQMLECLKGLLQLLDGIWEFTREQIFCWKFVSDQCPLVDLQY